MNTNRETYTNGNGKHSYEVEVFIAGTSNERKTFEVHAANRDQASRKVERDGHRVRSVNMIG